MNIKKNNLISKNSNEIVLLVVAHSDDETLGAGGTILRHIKSGDKVFAISMTNGLSSRDDFKEKDIKIRLKASEKASKILGFEWLKNENFPDNRMDTIPLLNIIKFIEDIKLKINPTIIYTHSYADLNIDHQKVAKAVLTSFRPQINEEWREIRLFEVPSSTDYGYKSINNIFSPNLYINIEKTWLTKLKALKAYDNEMQVFPNSRSYEGLENLAKYRGNQVGLKYAEAFEIVRKIIR